MAVMRFFFLNLFASRKHEICSLRKQECRLGCRLLHSLFPSWTLRPAVVALAGALLFALGGCGGGAFGPGSGSFNTVILDAGHGAHDRGARARFGKNEKDLCLDTALRMKPLLERAGFRVVMTRDRDVFIPLSRRTSISNRQRNAIFVSIHYNWARRTGAKGFETFYYTSKSRRLAGNIQQEILRAYPSLNRGVKNARFYVLRNNSKPAVLVELGFLSNPDDNTQVQKAHVRQRLAEAVVRGIIEERRGRNPRF
jgi:N-acetylmuramoyl-L-alanine amidase